MTAPDPRTQPRAFLEHLYRAAVHRALPLHNTGPFLPPPPRGRTLVVGAGNVGFGPTSAFGARRADSQPARAAPQKTRIRNAGVIGKLGRAASRRLHP